MPLFEYTCSACAHTFETLVQGTQKPVCPECGSRKLDKLISTFAVSGFSRAFAGALPPACGSCGDPRGPGACGMMGG